MAFFEGGGCFWFCHTRDQKHDKIQNPSTQPQPHNNNNNNNNNNKQSFDLLYLVLDARTEAKDRTLGRHLVSLFHPTLPESVAPVRGFILFVRVVFGGCVCVWRGGKGRAAPNLTLTKNKQNQKHKNNKQSKNPQKRTALLAAGAARVRRLRARARLAALHRRGRHRLSRALQAAAPPGPHRAGRRRDAAPARGADPLVRGVGAHAPARGRDRGRRDGGVQLVVRAFFWVGVFCLFGFVFGCLFCLKMGVYGVFMGRLKGCKMHQPQDTRPSNKNRPSPLKIKQPKPKQFRYDAISVSAADETGRLDIDTLATGASAAQQRFLQELPSLLRGVLSGALCCVVFFRRFPFVKSRVCFHAGCCCVVVAARIKACPTLTHITSPNRNRKP
jgi:hypothetical protein